MRVLKIDILNDFSNLLNGFFAAVSFAQCISFLTLSCTPESFMFLDTFIASSVLIFFSPSISSS